MEEHLSTICAGERKSQRRRLVSWCTSCTVFDKILNMSLGTLEVGMVDWNGEMSWYYTTDEKLEVGDEI